MHRRWSRPAEPRRVAALVALAALLQLVGVLLIGIGPAAVATAAGSAPAEPAPHIEPTVTFTDGGSPACDSIPSVSNLRVAPGVRVTLTNALGVAGSLDAGQEADLVIADGAGASVRLRPGQHAVRLIPHCDLIGRVEPVAVTVIADADPSAPPQADDPVEPPASRPPDGASGGEGDQGTTGSDPYRPSRDPVVPDTSGAAPAAGAGRPGAAPTGSGSPGVGPDVSGGIGEYGPIEDYVALPSGHDSRPSRVLALLAAICVFGVTSAIFRAILSQRTTHIVSAH